jgi:hypothetical protein
MAYDHGGIKALKPKPNDDQGGPIDVVVQLPSLEDLPAVLSKESRGGPNDVNMRFASLDRIRGLTFCVIRPS